MIRHRSWGALLTLLAAASVAPAQSIALSEQVAPGDCFRIDISLVVSGKMKVEREGKIEPIPLTAKASHSFLEQVEAVEARGGVGAALRFYQTAGSESEIGVDRAKRELTTDRRLIVSRRMPDGTLHYSPNGPLTREELDLVAEHFDTLCIPALIPGKDVKVDETWAIAPDAAQHVCLFQGLIKNELVGKLTEVKDGVATFTIQGRAEGVESGARVGLTVAAQGKYDVTTKRLVELIWEQLDDRDQGPASPATTVKARVEIKRTPLREKPSELGDAARAKVPAEGKIPELMLALRYTDPAGRYTFAHDRGWQVVGRTKDHLVLRLLDKSEFTAQATITNWRKADPGQHTSPAEFKEILAKLPGWQPDAPMIEGEVPSDSGRWIYRVAGKGKQDGQPVVQMFYLLAGPNGDQVAVTIVTRPEKAEKLSPKDLTLVNSIELPAKK